MSFQYELTTKQRFYLYLFQVCPLISIIDILWRLYKDESDKLILQDYSEIMLNEFTNNKISVKTDKFTSYFTKASIYLYPLQMIGHPYFICKINTTNEILNQYHNYYDGLLNQTQLKLRYSEKIIIMNRVIHNLLDFYSTNIEEVISYLLSLYYMFTNNRLLHSYPLAVDINNNLCRFE